MITTSLLASLLFVQGGIPGFGSGPDNFLLTEKQAYLVLPPAAIGDGQITRMEWSPTGRYLLFFRATPGITPAIVRGLFQGVEPPEPKVRIGIWDKSKLSTTDLGVVSSRVESNSLTWIPGADVAYGLVEVSLPPEERAGSVVDYRQDLVRIDLEKAEVKILRLTRGGSRSFVQLLSAANSPRILALFTEFFEGAEPWQAPSPPRHELLTIDREGRFTQATALPLGNVRHIQWVGDGKTAQFRMLQRDKGTPDREFFWAYDVAKLTAVPNAEGLKKYQAPHPGDPDMEVLMTRGQTEVGTIKRTFASAWLRSMKPTEQSEYLLAPRADIALLSPTADAVAVLDQGVVTVRLLAAVSKKAFFQAKARAERALIMNKAKQVGTALHMFAADHDDHFPTTEEWGGGEGIYPYTKNRQLIEGFQYTFSGGEFASIANPSGTMVGYIAGPGGFAVTFADSSVRWLKELPKN